MASSMFHVDAWAWNPPKRGSLLLQSPSENRNDAYKNRRVNENSLEGAALWTR
jgi:hypothetical protein